MFIYLFIYFYFTSLAEQDEAYINSSQWLTLVGLEPVYISMWVTTSTTVLHTPFCYNITYYPFKVNSVHDA